MNIQDMADTALKAFAYPDGTNEVGMTTQRSALIGFFRGVARGTIRYGQEWPIPILLGIGGISSKDQFNLIEQIFSSGMLCKGQELNADRKRTFADTLAK